MKHASLSSPLLQRVLKALSDGKPLTTRQIVRRAGVMAVSACVSELRALGAEIDCEVRVVKDQRRWFYTLKKAPTP